MAFLTVIENCTRCFICGQEIRFRIHTEEVECAPRIPYSILNVHGQPPHGVIIYVDRKAFVRGQDHVDKVELTEALAALLKSKLWRQELGESRFT